VRFALIEFYDDAATLTHPHNGMSLIKEIN